MKLATYECNNSVSCGIVTPTGMIDVPLYTENRFSSVRDILTEWPQAMEILQKLTSTVRDRLPLDTLKLLPPIPQPGKILALAGNYKKHLEETTWQDKTFDDQAAATNPWPFLMPPNVLTGTNTEIPWPVYSEQVDYEVELAIVIGKQCKNLSPEKAQTCIGGYTIANDVSARSVTFAAGRKNRPRDAYFDWLMGKWADGFLPMGPWIVTVDEIGDPQDLDLELTVNDIIRQKSNTSMMIFNVYEIVSFISHLMTLEPADVILTGTPHGVGLSDGNFLKSGDKMVCRIEKIGPLTNILGIKPKTFYKAFIR